MKMIDRVGLSVSMGVAMVGSVVLFGRFVVLPILSGLLNGSMGGHVFVLAILALVLLLAAGAGLYVFGMREVSK